MSYIDDNKKAWEEAFEHRHPGWGDSNFERLLSEDLPFFNDDVKQELRSIDFKGKTVGQFCCNNGRELLSLMQLGPARGVGFDIAENIIEQALETAERAAIKNCEFVACDILQISPAYEGLFDFIFFTIGAITWFRDINALFRKVERCLKPGGKLLINDFHPLMNALPMPGEPDFDPAHPDRFAYSYFRQEPWIENEGMSYMSESYDSKTFTSFSHTMGALITAISKAPLRIVKLTEYGYDVGLSDVYDNSGLPLSYLLIAEK